MFDPQALLREIAARPRPVGSEALAAARERCAHALREMGFDVREQAFEFSGFPGRFATPLIGGAGAALVGWAGGYATLGWRWTPLLVLGAGTIALALAARWLATRGVLAAPLLRARGVNLVATRAARPTVWLCAHLDSKSQPVPSLVRSAGIVVETAGMLLALVLSVLQAAGAVVHPIHWVQAGVLTLVGALPVVSSIVGARSPGAFDNASGVATVLAAAERLAGAAGVGVLVTDGEELGLAGARAWSVSGEGTVLNCDGIDDNGRMAVMYAGRRPARLLAAVATASRATGIPHEPMRLIPGILTDSVAFVDAGLASVTFSRGSVKSLLRIHGPRDDLAHLSGTGIAASATLVAETARQLAKEAGGGDN